MTTYRYRVQDPMNEWVKAIEIDAADPDQAHARASSWLFSRRDVGSVVHLTLVDPA